MADDRMTLKVEVADWTVPDLQEAIAATLRQVLVNLIGWIVQESSYAFRRLQTGLVQNYALLMLFGIFAFVSIYLFVR